VRNEYSMGIDVGNLQMLKPSLQAEGSYAHRSSAYSNS
jgi:hypothetical protein